jgi:hypothetical protein
MNSPLQTGGDADGSANVMQKSHTGTDKSAFAAPLGFCPLRFVRRTI